MGERDLLLAREYESAFLETILDTVRQLAYTERTGQTNGVKNHDEKTHRVPIFHTADSVHWNHARLVKANLSIVVGARVSAQQ
jgi:hypothetical protein